LISDVEIPHEVKNNDLSILVPFQTTSKECLEFKYGEEETMNELKWPTCLMVELKLHWHELRPPTLEPPLVALHYSLIYRISF
jgi:hypothetical protein